MTDSDPQDEGLQQEPVHENVAMEKWRYRVLYSKIGPLRYISNLDVARLWERICRRAQLPLAYSQGFNPRPKIQLAAGLPLGYLSIFEIVDLWLLTPNESLSELSEELNRASPEGIAIESVKEADLAQPALQSVTDRAIYRVRLSEGQPEDLVERIETFKSLKTCMRIRRDKQYDLRPLVDNLALIDDGPPLIEMMLALSQRRGTARPDEVMDALDLSKVTYDVTRVKIELENPHDLGI